MLMKMDPKKKAIEELMGYLEKGDDEELGQVVKPKGVEVTKIKEIGAHGEPDGDEAMPMEGKEESSESKMSPEELEELIEAIQSKLG